MTGVALALPATNTKRRRHGGQGRRLDVHRLTPTRGRRTYHAEQLLAELRYEPPGLRLGTLLCLAAALGLAALRARQRGGA